ncbi:universal stress protein [Natronorarus salvus]|uniref:universal stress protein n=1 Tax=Natronorarus salvus TaxID=3117733 RepID=UPI002F26DB25
MGSHVLVPVDGSPASRRAAEYAYEQFPDATVRLLYVLDPMVDYSRRLAFPGYTDEDEYTTEREEADAILDSLVRDAPEEIAVETELAAGAPAGAIVEFCDENDVDQIVIGSHGREGVARFLLGSVAETVVRRSVVPVTVVRPE